MTFTQIKSLLAQELASNDAVPRDVAPHATAAVTTISYQSGRKTWQTEELPARAGVVAAVTGPRGRKVVACDDSCSLNADTVFEIGSVTKVFTSLLLCDMVQRGEVALADPVSSHLPSEVKVPQRGGRQITFADLATHTSGLPPVPSNLKPSNAANPANPYAAYSVERLYEFLSAYDLPRDVGSKFEYSNLGVGLLGHALALRAGMDYEALLRARITGPLGMTDTAIDLSPAMTARLAPGHDCQQQPVANWDLPTFSGAGALRSTANDLLTFLEANLGSTMTPLAPAMAAMLNVRRPSDLPGVEIALGWHVVTRSDGIIVGHGGMTGGYSSFIGYDPAARVGVAVFSNAQWAGVNEIGLHLLHPKTLGSSG